MCIADTNNYFCKAEVLQYKQQFLIRYILHLIGVIASFHLIPPNSESAGTPNIMVEQALKQEQLRPFGICQEGFS